VMTTLPAVTCGVFFFVNTVIFVRRVDVFDWIVCGITELR
jgi:hypothetical protein